MVVLFFDEGSLRRGLEAHGFAVVTCVSDTMAMEWMSPGVIAYAIGLTSRPGGRILNAVLERTPIGRPLAGWLLRGIAAADRRGCGQDLRVVARST